MKILVVGSGAREHALAWKCMQSELTDRVYCAPGNGGTGGMARNVPISADDVAGLVRFAKHERIGLVVLGPESAVAAGVGDALRDAKVPVFGPNRGPGQIETSKAFAKELMTTAGVATPAFELFADAEEAVAWAVKRDGRVAVKADGLAQGKGVVVCGTVPESTAAINAMLVQGTYGRAGQTVVLEERIEGPELSIFALTDGATVRLLGHARDFKRARESDEGPNTGGMGAYSPPAGVDQAMVEGCVETVFQPVVSELANRGLEYRGVLYAGLILTAGGPQVIEFNARFGDPEAQVILPRLESDLVALMLTCARGDLETMPAIRLSDRTAVAIVVASGGYPDHFETGVQVQGLATIPPGVMVFHAGTRFAGTQGLITSGGRVLTCVGMGDDAAEARLAALSGAVRVRFPGAYFRTDIAQEAGVGNNG